MQEFMTGWVNSGGGLSTHHTHCAHHAWGWAVLRGGSLQLLLQLPGNARNSFAAFAAFFAAFAAFLQLSYSFRSFLLAALAASRKCQNVLGCLCGENTDNIHTPASLCTHLYLYW
jgi:hypothetical protein